MELVLAKCGNCGAALRVDPRAATADCEYCGVTSFVRGAPADAPQVTIAPAPEPPDETALTAGIGIFCVLLAAAGIGLVVAGHLGGLVLAAVGAPLAVLAAIGYPRKKEYLRQARLMREHGSPGRATVRSLGAGHGRSAKLVLDVEVGAERRSLTHQTEIPLLLIPSVTAGCTLPVLVHPHEPSSIEVQGHLM